MLLNESLVQRFWQKEQQYTETLLILSAGEIETRSFLEM